jgi:flagellar protein FliO/FliZ
VQLGRPRPWHLGLAVASALAFTASGPGAALAAFHRDTTPLPADVTGASTGTAAAAHASSGSSAVVRMLFGLAIVVAVIYAIYWVLKRASKSKDAIKSDGGMVVLSTTALAPSRALHLVQVGDELVLVGSAENGVTPIRVYSADEVRRLGYEVGATAPLQPFTPTQERARGSFGMNLLEEMRRRTVRG